MEAVQSHKMANIAGELFKSAESCAFVFINQFRHFSSIKKISEERFHLDGAAQVSFFKGGAESPQKPSSHSANVLS